MMEWDLWVGKLHRYLSVNATASVEAAQAAPNLLHSMNIGMVNRPSRQVLRRRRHIPPMKSLSRLI